MKVTVGDGMAATTTGSPLAYTPRFDFRDLQLIVAEYTDPSGRERELSETFGSMRWLWSQDEYVRFDRDTRELRSLTFFVPARCVSAAADRGPRTRAAGLRADDVGEFGMPQTAVFHCGAGAGALTCLVDVRLFDREPDARLGVAPDVDLLVYEGSVAGWSLGDPARYLTDGFTEPPSGPPAPATRLRLAECLELVSSPLVDRVMDSDPEAWQRLRVVERALREQREDRGRADVLHAVISRLIEDYEG
ncbi:hypothetical protein AMK18_07325 [Streptomyces sp. CB01249]|uniref:hypothetical protein n=1 Tax=Streptomyces sp. CB01249 TaxID=1703929 RepID=UPI00093F1611|nr:hypothetical protein [Streptomyces sp. CB01249]OKJ04976.1 hypothetical protein AMK18_07325 [Streptomyces sp. CB01249]